MKLSKLQVVILVILGLGILGVGGIYIFRAPIKGFVNGIRADRMYVKAQEAFEAENWVDAARLGTAAHHLSNDDLEIDLLVARALLKQRNASAVTWWKLVLEKPELPVEELRQLTTALLSTRQLEEALPFLSRLVELDGDSEETHRLWLQSLQLQHRYGKVRNLASQFAQEGSEDWNVHRAYIQMQQANGDGNANNPLVIEHLKGLIEEDSPLSLNAARELLMLPGIDMDDVNLAAEYLKNNPEDELDRLYAMSAQVKAGEMPRKQLDPVLNNILEDPKEGQLQSLLNWSRWMDAESWYLDKVDWQSYQANGGSPDGYLGLLYSEGRYDQLLELTETSASQEGEGVGTFLYYRSISLHETGEKEDARAALNLAVETVDPASYTTLERYLARDGHWDLLTQLYDIILSRDPDNSIYLVKALGARYYSGQQDDMAPILDKVKLKDFDNQPDIQGFILYARLLQNGFDPNTHKELEGLMARYPEIFDFRLILGVSYLLQNRAALGQELITDMPELGFNAPRYLRVAAAIMGKPAEDMLMMVERESLLPREKFLISLTKG